MISRVSLYYSYFLIVCALGMLGWGIAGFIEYLFDITVIIPLQNPNFPAGTQFIHWFLITLSGAAFLVGYFSRWKHTPFLMIVIYACLATMCFIETFDFMVREDRYTSYIKEVIIYIVTSIYLVKSDRMKIHFNRS